MRKKREPAVQEAVSDREGGGDGAFVKKRKMSWAAMIKKVYEGDPLRCPEPVLSLSKDVAGR